MTMKNASAWMSLFFHIITWSFASPVFVDAFAVWPGAAPLFSFDTTMMTSSSSLSMVSTPGGGWENDDFLESLSVNGGGASGKPMNTGDNRSEYEPVERIIPENDMTDEEITMMAMRAAQFYNTDSTMEEAYGIPRTGPPRKKVEDEGDFQ